MELQLSVEEVDEGPSYYNFCMAVIDRQALVIEIFSADTFGAGW